MEVMYVDTFGVRQIPELKFPLKNIKDRQTYFGALDYQTQEFIVRGVSMWKFIKHYQVY